MKINLLVFFGLFFSTYKANAQTICMVTADSVTGLDYNIYWEQPVNISNIDSVIIYRQPNLAAGFFRIGALKVSPTNPTNFTDFNANSTSISRYAIAFKDFSNVEGPRSLWHQPIVMDYTGSGNFSWSGYQIEDQSSPSYITEYRILIDDGGTGNYVLMDVVGNTEASWYYSDWLGNLSIYFAVEAVLPTCNFIQKANINTSRSNIKNEMSNAEAGVSESGLKSVKFDILSNPVSDNLEIVFSEELNNATIWISSTNGTQYEVSKLSGTEYKSSVTHLSQGMYFVNVEVNGVVSTKRFVKK